MSKIGIVFCFVAIVMQCGIAEKMHAAEENVEETLGKYNEENDFTTGLFKSKRAMLIWQKASRTEKLADRMDQLFKDLQPLDKALMDLKKMKYEKGDPYGHAESDLEEKLEAVLIEYGLAGKKNNKNKYDNKVKSNVDEDKLEQMYNKAVELGFSADELLELKSEILHHKRKMAELDALVGDLEALEEESRIASNVVDKKKAKNSPVDQVKVKELKLSINNMQREVDDGRTRLSLLSDTPGITKGVSFTQPKILLLWADIIKSNFSAEERESLKEELMHLEKKLNKKDRLSEEASLLDKHHMYNLADGVDKNEKVLQKQDKLREKTDELTRHVYKYEKDLRSKISERKRQTDEL